MLAKNCQIQRLHILPKITYYNITYPCNIYPAKISFLPRSIKRNPWRLLVSWSSWTSGVLNIPTQPSPVFLPNENFNRTQLLNKPKLHQSNLFFYITSTYTICIKVLYYIEMKRTERNEDAISSLHKCNKLLSCLECSSLLVTKQTVEPKRGAQWEDVTLKITLGQMWRNSHMRMTGHQRIPCVPRASKEYPSVAPTILCVVETGSFRNVAISNHAPHPRNVAYSKFRISNYHTSKNRPQISVLPFKHNKIRERPWSLVFTQIRSWGLKLAASRKVCLARRLWNLASASYIHTFCNHDLMYAFFHPLSSSILFHLNWWHQGGRINRISVFMRFSIFEYVQMKGALCARHVSLSVCLPHACFL